MNNRLAVEEHRIAHNERWRVQINGVVQGVGFRPFIHNLASQLALGGWVRNTSTGVELELQGPEPQLTRFLHHLHHDAPPLAHILSVDTQPIPLVPDDNAGLVIRTSRQHGQAEQRTLVSPDVATCRQCLDELFDTADRRFHYAFTNCTHCGPRFTIITGLPYDRPYTTMARFPLCPDCAQEYHDAADRRFHAQPVACPRCGPAVWYEPADGNPSPPTSPKATATTSNGQQQVAGSRHDDAIAAAASCLNDGGVVALKGLGGFHLACRADNARAAHRLRTIKARPHKPLAVMVPDLETARQLGHVSAAEETLLSSPEAPIVLLRQQAQAAPMCQAISPHNGYVGVMLPYTPLHHLLLRAVAAPLIMTSGNQRGEPLCIDNDEARTQLGGGCDGFLWHDRPIARRCDDSVTMVAHVDGRSVVQPVRRSRGLAPLPVLLPRSVSLHTPLVAAGADLKNVSAVAADGYVFLSQHIGNLDNPGVRVEQEQTIADLEELFRVRPRAVVCDRHPDYASSRYARRRAQEEGLTLIEVQHHHAHIAGCLAENDQTGPAIGLSFDGTGYGSDGRIWGGEILLADLANFERALHLEYLPLPGGDAAVKRPVRIAVAYLRTLLPQVDVADLLPEVPAQELAVLDTMLAQQLNTPLTSSMGRLFDAVSALLGLCHDASHEAQAAIALEDAALRSDADGRYEFQLDGDKIRLAPLLAQLVTERQRGVPVPDMARRFHRTVAEMAVASASSVRAEAGIEKVALSGGVWQNRLLLETAVPLLQQAGFEVLLHRHVPANDGGLAYGQTVVAAARMKEQ